MSVVMLVPKPGSHPCFDLNGCAQLLHNQARLSTNDDGVLGVHGLFENAY